MEQGKVTTLVTTIVNDDGPMNKGIQIDDESMTEGEGNSETCLGTGHTHDTGLPHSKKKCQTTKD
jgi:hypothetical protein